LFVLILILKITGWILLIPTLLLYGFIESFLDLRIKLKNNIEIQTIVRLVFVPIITLLVLALLGFFAGGIFLIAYFSLVLVTRIINLGLVNKIKIQNILKRFKSGKISAELAIKNIMKALKKESKGKKILVNVNSDNVNLKVNIPLVFGALVLKLIPKRLIREKSGISIDFSTLSMILKKLKGQKITVLVHSKSGEIVRVEVG